MRPVSVLETLGTVLGGPQSTQELRTTTQNPFKARLRRLPVPKYFEERITLTRSPQNKVQTITTKVQNITKKRAKDVGDNYVEAGLVLCACCSKDQMVL